MQIGRSGRALAALASLAVLALAGALAAERAPEVVLFSRGGCPRCARAHEFLAALARERPGLAVRVLEVDRDPLARERLEALARERGARVAGVPAVLVGGELMFGFDAPGTTGARIRALLDRSEPPPGPPAAGLCSAEAEQPCADDAVSLPLLGALRASEVGLPAFTLAVGLLDGFNPCAMWVLLFLLSLLVNVRSRRRMALVAGTFVLVSGAAYFAFMAAWLNVFRLIGFSRAVQVALGAGAALVGVLNVKEFLAAGRGPSLSIPDSARPGIYARVRGILQAENLAGALAGAAVLAVLVNFVELLCTAGFPALYTGILAARNLPAWKEYAYLALYNAAYLLDDSLMVGVAVATLSRRRLQEREGRWLKLVSGAVILALAAVLLLRPGWLAALG
jgi:hypothetical protein